MLSAIVLLLLSEFSIKLGWLKRDADRPDNPNKEFEEVEDGVVEEDVEVKVSLTPVQIKENIYHKK